MCLNASNMFLFLTISAAITLKHGYKEGQGISTYLPLYKSSIACLTSADCSGLQNRGKSEYGHPGGHQTNNEVLFVLVHFSKVFFFQHDLYTSVLVQVTFYNHLFTLSVSP